MLQMQRETSRYLTAVKGPDIKTGHRKGIGQLMIDRKQEKEMERHLNGNRANSSSRRRSSCRSMWALKSPARDQTYRGTENDGD